MSLKPIIEELMNFKANLNKDNIQSMLLNNVQENKVKLEKSLLNLAESTKNNPVIQEYVDQILKAELTNQAMEKLQAKFPNHDVVQKISELREQIIEQKNQQDLNDIAETNAKDETAQAKSNTEDVVDVEVEENTSTEDSTTDATDSTEEETKA